jgi:hypothetical protein
MTKFTLPDLLRSQGQSLVWPLYILSAPMILFLFIASSMNYICNSKQVRAFKMSVCYDCVSCETRSPSLSLVPHGRFDVFHTLALHIHVHEVQPADEQLEGFLQGIVTMGM